MVRRILSLLLAFSFILSVCAKTSISDSLSTNANPEQNDASLIQFSANRIDLSSSEFESTSIQKGTKTSILQNERIGREVKQYHFKWKQTILPASLIAVGAISVPKSFIRNGSEFVTNKVLDLRGEKNRLTFDDYIQYLPVASAALLGCTGVKARHPFWERTLIIGTSYAALGVLVNATKLCVNEKRPQFASTNSFPSGHTSTAFMGAELVRIEYGKWYGLGAYAVATCVGFMRLYNGNHWLHDVVAGAGFGILSARIGAWSGTLWHKALTRKSKKEGNFALTPIASPLNGGNYGFYMGYTF